MNSYSKSYNFGFLSTDDPLKGNDKIVYSIPKQAQV